MPHIDFSTIPEIYEHISQHEIQKLNEIFQDPEIIKQLGKIEINRIRRTRTNILLPFIFFLWIIFWTFITVIVVEKNQSASFVMAFILSLVNVLPFIKIFIIDPIYKRKIEDALENNIIIQIGKIIHPSFVYHPNPGDVPHNFGYLQQKNFFTFDKKRKMRHAIAYTVSKDRTSFQVNGIRAYDANIVGLKNTTQQTGNMFYVLKITFPQARIKLTSDVHILSERIDNKNPRIFRASIIFGVLCCMVLYIYHDVYQKNILHEIQNLMIMFLFLLGILFLIFTIGRVIPYLRNKKVFLENVYFENDFNVYSDDEIESRMILTPAIMEKITQYTRNDKKSYSFLFTKNTLYIKKRVPQNYMQVDTSKNIVQNVESFLQIYIDMRQLFTFVQDIDLLYFSKTIK